MVKKLQTFPGYIELNSKAPLSRIAMKFRTVLHLCQDLNSLGFHICKGLVTSSVVRGIGIGIIYLQYSNDSNEGWMTIPLIRTLDRDTFDVSLLWNSRSLAITCLFSKTGDPYESSLLMGES